MGTLWSHGKAPQHPAPGPTPSQGRAPPAALSSPRLGVRPEARALARKPRPDVALLGCKGAATPGCSAGPGHPTPPRPPTQPLPRASLEAASSTPGPMREPPRPRPSRPVETGPGRRPAVLGGGARGEGAGEGAWEGGHLMATNRTLRERGQALGREQGGWTGWGLGREWAQGLEPSHRGHGGRGGHGREEGATEASGAGQRVQCPLAKYQSPSSLPRGWGPFCAPAVPRPSAPRLRWAVGRRAGN